MVPISTWFVQRPFRHNQKHKYNILKNLLFIDIADIIFEIPFNEQKPWFTRTQAVNFAPYGINISLSGVSPTRVLSSKINVFATASSSSTSLIITPALSV